MRFLYQYRTPDNAQHDGTVEAPDRDAAFAALKARGLRPSRLVEAPGFFNKLFGKGKRWLAIGVLAALCLSLGVRVFRSSRPSPSPGSAQPRHQLYGDPALIEDLERTGFGGVFPTEGERMLAWFARPGLLHAFTNSDWRAELARNIPEALATDTAVSGADAREVAELKRIVKGMKDEIRRYLANGVGTPATYVARLLERQVREAQIYNRAVADLKDERDPERWERINASLRRIGLRTVSRTEREDEQ